MNLTRLRELCLSLPGSTEQIQWGKDLVFKVGGKMFCVACTEPVSTEIVTSFKCDPETFAELTERDGLVPAPYLARAKWVGLQQWDALEDGEYALQHARAVLEKRVDHFAEERAVAIEVRHERRNVECRSLVPSPGVG